VHRCCLIDGDARYFAEDLGRHNALDKVIGQYLAAGPADSGRAFLWTTGRVSAEVVSKAARAGLGLVVSRAAVTDRAVDTARQADMTLIGFARNRRFNVYYGGEERFC
jgi:FdhD protein